jgi:hypothetical protein
VDHPLARKPLIILESQREVEMRLARVVVAGLSVAAGGVPAEAAEVARSMAELEARLAPGARVDVVDRDGRVYRGDFARADADGVLLTAGGSDPGRRIAAADVISVTRDGDPVKNGALIGGGIGLASSLLLWAADDEEFCDAEECVLSAVFVTATYAGIGALVDHLVKGRTVVYRAPAGAAVSVGPQPVRGGAGLRLTLRF